MEEKREQSDISALLLKWYDMHKRDLPWRESNDPYRVWLSEVILQQTRVAQGWSYYLRFVDKFPNVQSLADADEQEVLKLWQGLGYYSRARNLHAAAKQVIDLFHGRFPDDYASILSLKGVGTYTAAAVSSIAFNAPYAVVDGNVFRVISRLFAVENPIDTTAGKKIITEIAQSLLSLDQPGTYNQAIMDFGSLVCTPTQPRCMECPLQNRCQSFLENRADHFPVTSRKVSVRKRYFHYFHIDHANHTYIQKRKESDIWKNLYEFPLIETAAPMDFLELSQTKAFRDLFPTSAHLSVDHCLNVKHQLTHQLIYTVFYRVIIGEDSEFIPPEGLLTIERENLSHYPVSRLTDKYMEII